MRILFMGTATFAVPSLRRLHDSPHEILAVVTQPDRPHGRGNQLAQSPVKEAAALLGYSILQPERVRAKEFVQIVRDMAPDVLVVAAFGQIIPQRMLDIPAYGSINVHGSILPRWRGAAPIQYALMAGDSETGVTTMQMDAGLDSGDMILIGRMPLADDDNYGTVEIKLSGLGADLLMETLTALEAGTAVRTPQDPALVTLSPSLPPDIGRFDWRRPAVDLHNLTRGVTPRPGAFVSVGGRRLKIWKTQIGPDSVSQQAGMVQSVGSDGITVGAGSGSLTLLEVQPESKGRMPAAAWARGARVAPGFQFDVEPGAGE